MLDYKSFTSYYPIESGIHKINSIVKLLCFFTSLCLLILSNNLKLHVFMIFVTLYLLYISKIPIKFYIDIIFFPKYLYIILIFMLASKGLYLDSAIIIILKILIFLLYTSCFFYTTSQSEIKYAFYVLMSPLRLFKININKIIDKIITFMSFFPVYFQTKKDLFINSSSRGLDYFHTDVLSYIYRYILNLKNSLRLTIENLKKMHLTSYLMGYSEKTKITNLRTNKIGIYDILLIAIHLSFIIYFAYERGWL